MIVNILTTYHIPILYCYMLETFNYISRAYIQI